MQPERPAPRVVKVTDTAKLLALEDTAAALGRSSACLRSGLRSP